MAVGGDLSVPRLLAAYRSGIFPWYEEGVPPLWWSPDPRGVLYPEEIHVSRSLARKMRRGGFTLTWNRAFTRVMRECGLRRRGGTWIFPEMIAAYTELHREGHAHSLEVWSGSSGDDLVGGIYCVQAGALLAAESMFHRVADASKIALAALARGTPSRGVRLIDVQFTTPHLERMGARDIPRRDYLSQVESLRDAHVDLSAFSP